EVETIAQERAVADHLLERSGTSEKGAPSGAEILNEAVKEPSARTEAVPSATPKDRPLIAHALDQYRQDCGWTIDDLAAAVDLDRSVIASHTTGAKAPRLENLQRYAELFSKQLGLPVTIAALR